MSLTDVTLCGKTLCSQVIAASGTFGFGGEYAGIVDMKKLGGISGKGLTLEGFYYPLHKFTLTSYTSIGISNEIVEEEARISFDEGVLVMIESKD